jgi:hypothetical protein
MKIINNKYLKGYVSNLKTLSLLKAIILSLFLFCVLNVNAQLDKQLLNISPTKSFRDINLSEKLYLDSLKTVIDSTTYYSGGGEYKTFKRFKNIWEPRLFPDKKFDTYLQAEQTFYENTSTNYVNASSEQWSELGPTISTSGIGPAEFVTFFDNGTPASTQYMLAGSLPGGLFYSKDFGETWLSTGSDNWERSGCSWAVFHPTNHQIWCASSSGNSITGQSNSIGRTGGIYLTLNEGQTWNKKADYLDFGQSTIIRKLIYEPTNENILFVATSKGLYKTVNLSSSNPTWTKILDLEIYDLEMKPGNNITMFVTCKEYNSSIWKVKKSPDQGATWTDLFSENNATLTIEVSKAKPEYLYMCKTNGAYCSILYNFNNVWTTVLTGSDMSFGGGHAFGVDQLQNGENILISNDVYTKKLNITNSTTSTSYPVHVDVEDVVYHPYNPNEVWICTHGGVEKSINGGVSWVAKYTGFGAAMTTKMATSFSTPDYVMLGLYHDGTQVTRTPYSDNWKPTWAHIYGCDGQQPLIDNKAPNNMWVSTQGPYGYSYSDNYFLNAGTFIPNNTYWYSIAVLNKENSNFLYRNQLYQGSKEEVYRTTSKGANNGSYISGFRNLLNPASTKILMIGMVTPHYNNDYLIAWVLERDAAPTYEIFHLFRTTNATSTTPTWQELSIPRQGWINDIEIDPNNINILYLCFSGSTDESLWPLSKELIYKMDYSNPTVPVFTNLTKNLPYTSTGLYCLERERGSDGVFYLATDFGVFTTNNQLLAGSNSWQTYGEGLPHSNVNGIEINYTKNLLRVGTEGRGAWEISLPCNYSASKINIYQNTTWNTVERLNRGVVVKSGFTLTLNQSARISFPAGDGVIVEPGAKLIVNGATLTNSCYNSPWQGIQVWGYSYQTQFPNASGQYQQGYLELNNATIENAIIAVDLWKPNDYAKTGGIVIATNSNFINNTNSVHAAYYTNHHPTNGYEMDNIANFTNCTFSLNQNYIPANTFYKHVDLALVRGAKFNGCDFSLANDAPAVSESNQAIQSYSSSFYVNATCTSPTMPCSNFDKCTFTGFNWGIKATNDLNSTRTFSVNRAVFSNNTFGIHVTGVRNESILNSEFAIGNNHAYCTNAQGYGIYLDNSTGFAIEENTFTKMAGAPQANYFGVQVNNSNGTDDVYKNTLTGLSYANYGSLHDYGIDSYQGLEWGCNQNSNNYADFYVSGGINSGVQAFQGQISLAAGNTFSSNATWHFYNGGNHLVNYYYNASISAQVPDVNKINIPLVNRFEASASNTCPSHYGGGGSALSSLVLNDQQKTEREVQYASALADYTNVKTLYNNLKDGGSTDAKLADIETAQPQDMWALRAELLGSSPHLSKEVLLKVADKTTVFSESVIFDILSANPDELKNEDLLKYLEDKENPLPQYMIDILRQVATGTSYKTVLQQQMALHNRSKTRAANDMIRSYLNDTVTDYAQLRNWLDNLGGIEADRQIVASYAQEGNYNSALALANAMPQLYNLQGTELTEHNQYMQLLALQQTLQNENRGITMLTEPEIAELVAIAEINKSSAGATAKGILESFYSKHFCDCPEVAGATSFKNSRVDPAELGKIYGLDITAKPNPATDWVAFDYKLPENESTANLTLTDITGKTIESFNLNGQQGQKVWDTRDIKPGTYIYTLKVASYNKTGKIAIVR